jgi:DNA-binding NarL/FixJ family response regulator
MNLIPASVLIIESHPLMREALCAAISDEPDLSVGMKVANGAEALQVLRVILPDIILFAMGNPGIDELEALKIVRFSLPETPILALTSNEVLGQEQVALEAGACAVQTKVATRSELITALREMRMKALKKNSQDHLSEEANEKKDIYVDVNRRS